MSIFFSRLKTARKSRRLTLREVAAACDIQLRAYQRYEAGEREPNFDRLIAIADLLNVSTDYLLGRTDRPDAPAKTP